MSFDLHIYLNLFLCALVPVIASVLFLLFEKFTRFGKLPYIARQIIIGIIFGGVAIIGTEFGVDVGGAVANARDAGPLCAGLFFGAPAGIIAGLIGGVERWFAVAWGAGAYSRVACTVSTILAGFYAAFLRKFIFDNKRPTPIFGFATGGIMEILHVVILSLTHMEDSTGVLSIVEKVLMPMTLCNAAAVWLSALFIAFVLSGSRDRERSYRRISQQVQTPLLIAVILAFTATSSFVFILQTKSAEADAANLLAINLTDIVNDISDETQENLQRYPGSEARGIAEEQMRLLTVNRHIGETGYIVITGEDGACIGEEKSGLDAVRFPVTERKSDDAPARISIEGVECFCDSVIYEGVPGKKYVVTAIVPEEEIYLSRDKMTYVNACMEILVFGALFIVVYIIIKRIVVNKIRKINDSLGKIIGGDLNTVVSVRSSDEFASLSDDINSTVGTLKKYIDEAAGRIDRELAFAHHIQNAVLPSVFPAFPERKDFDIYATMNAAREVGGDFYDFYLIDDNTVGFLVADVSGKGIPAAMFMMTAKTMIKDFAEAGVPADGIFTRANARLCSANEAEMFVTGWLGVLDLKTGLLTYVNAGHNPPLIRRADGEYEYLRSRPDLVLACIDDIVYHAHTTQLSPGDRLYLYTDGVTEAQNEKSELYGERRLLSVLNNCGDISLSETLSRVRADIDDFAGSAEQADDITMLIFGYTGGRESETKIFPAETSKLDDVLDFVGRCAERVCENNKTLMQISVSVEEAFVNVASYAYDGEKGDVTVTVVTDGDGVTVTLADGGKPFDPLKAPAPDDTVTAENDVIGGLGIFMIRKQMDEVAYRYEDEKNVLTMKKLLK